MIPYKHYIPLKPDLSDILEKFYWMEANQEVCREIVKNAK
jgi:hypothetical protein